MVLEARNELDLALARHERAILTGDWHEIDRATRTVREASERLERARRLKARLRALPEGDRLLRPARRRLRPGGRPQGGPPGLRHQAQVAEDDDPVRGGRRRPGDG